MHLANIFLNNRPVASQDYTAGVNTNQQLTAEAIKQQISSLTPGQTILGEIIGKNGSEVQIRLLDELLIHAKLDQDMNLEVGRNMTFQVKNNGSVLTLSPLYENMATDATAMKALDMAGIPLTDKTFVMASKLMEQGLPVDKNTLQQVYREMNMYPTTEVGDIVNLHKFGVEVNETNLNQYAAYKNLNNSLLQGMNQVLQDVPDMLGEMVAQGKFSEAGDLLKLFMNLASGRTGENTANVQQTGGEGTRQTVPGATVEGALTEGSLQQAAQITEGQKQFAGNVVELLQAENENVKWDANGIRDLLTKAGENPANIDRLMSQLEQLQIANGKLPVEGKDVLQQLFEVIKNKWLLEPEEMETPGKVQELYSRLNEQLTELAESMEQMAQTNSNVYKATTNMVQNLDFMQQLNQMYTYVQLPIRLQQGEAHGDLYVYTNKKHLAAKDGQISALLHLDMDHLGPVDVYVAMQNERLSTNFYLQDEEMLDFINDHLDILTERLAKRGYNCNCQLQVRNQEGTEEAPLTGIDSLLEQDVKVPIAMYSFDVRG